MKRDNTIEAFFALVGAGLWERDVDSANLVKCDFNRLYNLAEEQAVIGLIAAGLDHVKGTKIPKDIALQFIGQALQLEQQNTAMNNFISELVEELRDAGIYTLLVKGQSVAQCYERPLWRACGDVDFYLSDDNFQKAKAFFRPLVESFDPDNDYTRHINMQYGPWVVEIHGNQHTNLSRRVDKELDGIHYDLFYSGNNRSYLFGKTQVFLPSAESDIMIVFTHFIKHFYKGGLGIRQICDWCRLIWSFRNKMDLAILENWLKKMGLMGEWKAFGAFAVNYLGMPADAMPFYEEKKKWQRKAEKIELFILEVGNFGHNRAAVYNENQPRLLQKALSYSRRIADLIHHTSIFPWDSVRFLFGITINGLRSTIHED